MNSELRQAEVHNVDTMVSGITHPTIPHHDRITSSLLPPWPADHHRNIPGDHHGIVGVSWARELLT